MVSKLGGAFGYQAMNARSTFLTIVFTPITYISSKLQIRLSGYAGSERDQEYLYVIDFSQL